MLQYFMIMERQIIENVGSILQFWDFKMAN